MKFLVVICGLAALLVGAAVGCGPQNPYCPANGGMCFVGVDAGPDLAEAPGLGDAIIFGSD
jgi:hypothetical protein